jgi:photosystem II stability/assembly factor-like uncharacterized protein
VGRLPAAIAPRTPVPETSPALTLPLRAATGLAVVILGLVPLAGAASAGGFLSVYSRDGTDVWAVGDTNTIFRSLDGGATWSNRTLGDQPLRGIAARGFTVLAVGDSGKIWRSFDSGNAWFLVPVVGGIALHAVEFPTPAVAYVVGAFGAVLKSVNGGVNWSIVPTPLSSRLRAARFLDADHGWIVGEDGTVLHTTNGGQNWSSLGPVSPHDLLAVDVAGDTVWVVGEQGTCLRSVDVGASWQPVDLRLPHPADLRGLRAHAGNDITITGGGGFIVRSRNGGATWTYGLHPLIAPTHDVFFHGPDRGWVSTANGPAVLRTVDGGATWLAPTGMSATLGWQLRQPLLHGAIKGLTLAGGADAHTLYAALGPDVFVSRDRGDNWSAIATIPGAFEVHAFLVSPADTNVWVAAVRDSDGSNARVLRTTTGGAAWNVALPFAFFGPATPIEMDPVHPDTLFFAAASGVLWRSTNFGASWAEYSSPGFQRVADLAIAPDSAHIVLVSEGAAGAGQARIMRSKNGGFTFSQVWPDGVTSGGAEVPALAIARLDPARILATHAASGGVHVSADFGLTWPQVATTATARGADWAHDDPTMGAFGVASGNATWQTFDRGATFTSQPIAGANVAMLAHDRSSLIAAQGNGLHKLYASYLVIPNNSQIGSVVAPNGGEQWPADSVRQIRWNMANVPLVRIEFRRAPGQPWELVADFEGYLGTYAWTVPHIPTTLAKIRVRDIGDSAPSDTSNNAFTIRASAIAVAPGAHDFGNVALGSSATRVVTFTNPGTAPLSVANLACSDPRFRPGRTALTVAAGGADTTGVTFTPVDTVAYAGSLTLTCNVPGPPPSVALAGHGVIVPTLTLTAPAGGEAWAVGTAHAVTWQSLLVNQVALEYAKASNPGAWIPIAASVAASAGSFNWTVPNDTSSSVRVRIREVGGPLQDESLPFAIVVSALVPSATVLDLGYVQLASVEHDSIGIQNPGNGPLVVTSVTSSDPEFWVGRTSFTIAARGHDTLGVYYAPANVGRDTTQLTIVSNAPGSPHVITVRGEGTTLLDAGDRPPVAFTLAQNRPNPTVGTTTIHYALPRRSTVLLEVFDVAGHRIATLRDGEQEAGWYAVPFGPGARTAEGGVVGRLASGVYFYRLRCDGEFAATRKMMLLR